LRWALARLPLHEEEKARLAREAFEAKGFVSKLEQIPFEFTHNPRA
jgi:hypothetical protein